MPADGTPPVQTTSQVHQKTPSPVPPPAQPPYLSTPDVPTRNPHRKSGEHPYRVSRDAMENPVSPVDGPSSKHNFSYPSRSTLREPDDPAAKRSSGAVENLKAAAIGLHVSHSLSCSNVVLD